MKSQEFSNKKAEFAFKELFCRIIENSQFLYNCPNFIKEYFDNEKELIRNQFSKEVKVAEIKKLAKKIKTQIDYTLLLHFEVLQFCKILKNSTKKVKRDSFFIDSLNYSERKKDKIWNQINNLNEIKNKKIKLSFCDALNFISSQEKYNKQKIFNIAICATMSAGKSTFVNALLGNDYLPSRNEATTAKITSVYDNDAQQKMIGFSADENGKIFEISGELNREKIDSWNSNPEIKNIYLQSDLDSISSENVICAVHDTPGTNNSADGNHRKITMDFLTSKKLDMIIFVANATQLKTTDEKKLLAEIYENVVQKKNLPVLFVLNKADAFDAEKENLSSVCENYKKYIEEIGYRNCEVMPVSAKAARLFKMALKGKSELFTESEYDDFPLIFNKFLKRFDFEKNQTMPENSANEELSICDENYSKKDLIQCLYKTGIKDIENYISKIKHS